MMKKVFLDDTSEDFCFSKMEMCIYALLVFGIMFEMAIRMHLKIFAR